MRHNRAATDSIAVSARVICSALVRGVTLVAALLSTIALAELPSTVVITKPTTMALAKSKGSLTLRSGTEVNVIRLDGDMLEVTFRNVPGRIPVSATNFSPPPESAPAAPANAATKHEEADAEPPPDIGYQMPSRDTVLSWLNGGQYERIEKLAAHLRRQPLSFHQGYLFLRGLYDDFSNLDTSLSDEIWDKRAEGLKKWIHARPESSVALIAFAQFEIYYGWKARGEGFSDTVTPEMRRVFRARLTEAKSAADKAAQLPSPDVETFRTQVILAKGLGLGRDYMETAFKRGVEIEPNYFGLYEEKAMFLLPRWHGQPGECDAWATKVSSERGGDAGDILYMVIARAVEWEEEDDLFQADGTPEMYPRVVKGCRALSRYEPYNGNPVHTCCLFACLAGDKAAAKKLFDIIGSEWQPNVWKSKERFDRWQAWANESDSVLHRMFGK